MISFLKKKKGGQPAGAADSKKNRAAKNKSTIEQPELAPGAMVAMHRSLCPVTISTQGYTCKISYVEEKSCYRLIMTSKSQEMSDELIDPTDRKKKAVTDFSYKGLFGIHVHPSGILLLLDVEEDFKGQARKNQPAATITSSPPPDDYDDLEGRRICKIGLVECTEHNPLLVAPNNGKFHMQIKPIADEEEKWGVYLSNPKGHVREESPAVLVLEKHIDALIDRKLFTSRTSGDGGIDARNWNKAIADPVIARLQVDKNNILTIEEMFTATGMTLMLEVGKPIPLGLPGLGSAEQDADYQKQFADVLLDLYAATAADGSARDLESDLLRKRNAVVAEAAQAIKKVNSDGVSKLALELAVKEVLAPFYSGSSGAETASGDAVSILNAVVTDLTGWVEADSSRALAVSAIETAFSSRLQSCPGRRGSRR